MLRGLTIASLVLAIVFGFISLYYMEYVHNARMSAIFSDFDYYESARRRVSEGTMEIGLITLAFLGFFIGLYILKLIKIKTTTIKVLSIIGLSLTGIMIAWNSLMMSSPNAISFDEVGGAWVLLSLVYLGFGIPGVVHAFRAQA